MKKLHPPPHTRAHALRNPAHKRENSWRDSPRAGPWRKPWACGSLSVRRLDCGCAFWTWCAGAEEAVAVCGGLPPLKGSCGCSYHTATADAPWTVAGEPSLSTLSHNTTPCRTANPAGRRKEEVANSPALAPVLGPQPQRLYRGYTLRGLSGSGEDPSRPVQAKSLQEKD